jgi:hypothetical protein
MLAATARNAYFPLRLPLRTLRLGGETSLESSCCRRGAEYAEADAEENQDITDKGFT